jgi:DNA topoisomerase-3
VQNLASPELTGNWEARLSRMARGQEQRAVFMADIATYVKEVVDAIRGAAPMAEVPLAVQKPPAGKGARRPSRAPKTAKTAKTEKNAAAVAKPASQANTPREVAPGIADLVCPVCKQGPIIVGKRGWGCSRWRAGCKFVVWFEADGKKRSESDLRTIVRTIVNEG